jgi:two-component system, OmpR family, alkaline phosphatase synthesis response regulator PhoP
MAKILVVDDEPDIIRLVSRIMESRGHLVITAKNGSQALHLVRDDPPDLIILDLDLPQMKRLDVCRKIKSDRATGHIPIIMMTQAYVSLADAKRVAGLGEYIFKPFMSEVLLHNVQRLLPGH